MPYDPEPDSSVFAETLEKLLAETLDIPSNSDRWPISKIVAAATLLRNVADGLDAFALSLLAQGRPRTPAEARKAWTTALRSGEFAQGRGHLGDATLGYCCLGVACKLAMDAGVIDGYNFADPELPTEVCNWLGLSDVSGHYVENEDEEHPNTYNLAEVNDSGTSFERIAAIIEAEPDELLAT